MTATIQNITITNHTTSALIKKLNTCLYSRPVIVYIVKTVKWYSSSEQVMGCRLCHSVTFHLTQVNMPRLKRLVLD